MPWQQAAIDVAYEYDPETDLFRYDELDFTVPRQSGKTTLVLAKKVHRLTVMARRLGPQRSMYTAQLRLAARRKLERDFAVALRSSRAFREVPHSRARPTKATEWRLSLNNGNEHIQFGSGSYLQIDAPSRTGGHGDTLDDGDIDEAFAHETDEIEAAMRPAMATRKNAQMWVTSTAGDERSFYLYRKILAGRAAHQSGQHGRVASIEYSAPDESDPGDPATWWACMPALGLTIPLSFIQGEWERAQRKGPEGIVTFRRAYLNQWPNAPVLGDRPESAVINLDLWGSLGIRSQRMARPTFCVEVAIGRASATIGAAWLVKDRPHIEIVEDHPGVDWVVTRVADLARTYNATGVVLDAGTEAAGLAGDLGSRGIRVTLAGSADRVAACGGFHDRVAAAGLTHNGDPALAEAIGNARWKDVGDGARVFSRRRSAGDISALYAAVFAVHGLTTRPAAAGYVSIRERLEARNS